VFANYLGSLTSKEVARLAEMIIWKLTAKTRLVIILSMRIALKIVRAARPAMPGMIWK